jgi:hypothetical protein
VVSVSLFFLPDSLYAAQTKQLRVGARHLGDDAPKTQRPQNPATLGVLGGFA